MDVLILVWVLIGVGVLDHAACGLRFQHDPGAVLFLQIVSDLHARTGGSTGLGPELNLGMGLISVDGDTAEIHVHSADVERANTREVLHDAGANGVAIAGLFLTTA